MYVTDRKVTLPTPCVLVSLYAYFFVSITYGRIHTGVAFHPGEEWYTE